MSEQLVPEIRFEGFEDEWAVRPLISFAQRVQRKNSNLETTRPLTISAEFGLVDQFTYFNNRVASRDLTNYLLIMKGEFAYNKSYSEGHPVGTVKRLDRHECGALSTLYVAFRVDQDGLVEGEYLSTFFETSLWHRFIEMRAAEGARNHGLLNIAAKDFLDVPVPLARAKDEQKAIGSLFTDLDASIDQHRRKHQQLKRIKASLLERMFPAPGETVPQIRFEGFDGEWREYPLRQLGVAKTGFGFPHSAQGGRSGIPFFKVSDMNLAENSSTMRVANNYVTSGQAVRHGWHPIVDVPAIVFAKVGAAVFLGRKRTVLAPFLMDNNMMAFCIDEQRWDASFARVLFESLDLSQLVQVGALPSFNPPQLHDMVVTVPPTLAEQKAIGQFFAKLDALIEAEQHRVAKLQQVKASLLQKMFV